MQTLPSTLTDPGYGVAPAKDKSPGEMKRVGQDYRKAMFNKYNDPTLGLMAYNWGPKNVDDWIANGGDPKEVPDETKDYVKNIHHYYSQLKSAQPTTTTVAGPQDLAAENETKQLSPLDQLEKDLNDPNFGKSAAAQPSTPTTNTTPSAKLSPLDQLEKDLNDPNFGKEPATPDASGVPTPTFNKDAGVGESAVDMAKSVPTGIVQGVNHITQLPISTYNFGNQLFSQEENKLHNLVAPDNKQWSPEQQAANIRSAGTTYQAPSLSELAGPSFTTGAAFAFGNALHKLGVGSNQLTENDLGETAVNYSPTQAENALHQPTTPAGQVGQGLGAAIPQGAAMGVGAPSAVLGAGGMMAANTISPDNPTAQVLGGMLGAGIPKAKNLLTGGPSSEAIADNILQQTSKGGGGGGPPPGGSSPGIKPADIDLREIVPGSKPTLAEATGDPNIALIERQKQMQDPAAFAANEAVRENARKQHFEKASGTPEDIEALKTQRETTTEPLYETARVQPLNTTAIAPVIAKIGTAINEVGAGSDAGKTLISLQKKIQSAMPAAESKNTGVLDAQGNPIVASGTKNSTQSPLIQIYREERDNLQKPSTAQGAYAATVKSVIQPIVGELGDAIESQSPEFAKAQQAYRDISPKINAMQWLQNLKLTNATGQYTLAKVNNALQNAQTLRKSPGQNAAKNLSDEQLQTLQNIRDDLLRREKVAGASMPRNSTTVQNTIATNALNSGISGKLSSLIGKRAPGLGAGLGSMVGGPVGAYFGEMMGEKVASAAPKRAAAANNNLQNYLLNPAEYKQYLVNQLQK
jgi:hypothetical protein